MFEIFGNPPVGLFPSEVAAGLAIESKLHMKSVHVALLGLLFLMTPSITNAATAPTPPREILALAQTVIDAGNANDATRLTQLYTDDAVVIDEGAPFRWTGPEAGVKWWQHVEKAVAAGHATLHATARPPTEYRVDREGDDAYLIQPVTVTIASGGKTRSEDGTQTYTFHKANGTWKISSATWTTKPQ